MVDVILVNTNSNRRANQPHIAPAGHGGNTASSSVILKYTRSNHKGNLELTQVEGQNYDAI